MSYNLSGNSKLNEIAAWGQIFEALISLKTQKEVSQSPTVIMTYVQISNSCCDQCLNLQQLLDQYLNLQQ